MDGGAFNPPQLVALLAGQASASAVTDEKGTVTDYAVSVEIDGRRMTPVQAVAL